MRVRIEQGGKLDDDGVVLPTDPPEPINISDAFELTEFRASSELALPLSSVAVNWSIQPTSADVQVADYQFRLLVPGHVQLNAIQAQGSAPFTITSATRATISGRKGTGPWSSFNKEVLIELDQSNCEVVTYIGNVFDGLMRTMLDQFLLTVDQLRLRSESKPANPQNPNSGASVVQLEMTSDYTTDRIRFDVPLEIRIPYFFDADLDVKMDVHFSLSNDETGSDLDIDVSFDIDASFDIGEHILSSLLPLPGGSTIAISKTLDAVLPMVFNCQRGGIESAIASFLLDSNVRTILSGMRGGRIFDIRISPVSATANSNNIYLVLCPSVGDPPVDGGTGGVVQPVRGTVVGGTQR